MRLVTYEQVAGRRALEPVGMQPERLVRHYQHLKHTARLSAPVPMYQFALVPARSSPQVPTGETMRRALALLLSTQPR